MTVADEDNPMFDDAYRKKLREENIRRVHYDLCQSKS